MQFNDGGTSLGGTAGFTFDKTSNAVAVTGNITSGNVTVNGANAQVVMAGTTSNKVNFGTTGFGPPTVGSYSNGAKVVLYDSISPTNAGYAIGIDSYTMWFGTDMPGSNFEYFVGNAKVAAIEANGTVTAGAVNYTATDGTVGQVLTTYGNGQTYFSTVSGGSGSPGGANTQIQFNDGSAFAGNAQMTFDKVTGNVAFGNLIISTTNPNNAAVITNLNTLDATARPLLERIVIGAGFDGDFGNTGDYFNTTRNSAVTTMNRWNQASTSNTNPMVGQSVATWYNNTSGNTITSAGNARGVVIDTFYTGSRWGNVGTSTLPYRGVNINTVAGNGVSGGSVGTLVGMAVNAGTNSNNASSSTR